MIQVTVVVPVFNGSKYLSRTLNSILEQDIDSLEIIVVDDGSTDNTIMVTERCFESVDRDGLSKQIISQKNSGVSVARNTGLLHAAGKYIVFFDGDDLMDVTYARKMWEAAERENADLVVCGHNRMLESGTIVERHCPVYTKTGVVGNDDRYFPFQGRVVPWTGCLLYRTDYLKNNSLQYQRGCTNSEDIEFIWKAWILAEKITFVPEILVSYILRSGTASRTSTLKRFHTIGALRRLSSFLKKHNASMELIEYFDSKVIPESFITVLSSLLYEGFPKKEVLGLLRNPAVKREIAKYKPSTFKERIKSVLYKKFPTVYFSLYSLKMKRRFS